MHHEMVTQTYQAKYILRLQTGLNVTNGNSSTQVQVKEASCELGRI